MNTVDLGYISHLPVLGAVLAKLSGPVLELGAGNGSTPLVHYMSAASGRYVLTAESDDAWLGKFRHYHYPGRHDFRIVRGGETVTEHIEGWVKFCVAAAKSHYWSVCFVDQAPGEARVPCIEVLKNRVSAFVVHDFEADEPPGGGNYGWKKLDGLFRHVSVMRRIRPWTAVLSDLCKVKLEEEDECPEKCS